MRPQKQRFNHRPEQGEYGDCYRTALASLLDLDRDIVPNFGEHYDDTGAFFRCVETWLNARGLHLVEIPYKASLADLLAAQQATNPRAYYLLSGMSDRGLNHSVIACGGGMIFDPHPDDTGLVGPCNDGYFWVSYIVPVELTVDAALGSER